MKSYWVTFKDNGSGCVEASDEVTAMTAARIETGRIPIKAEILPYPADPRIVLHKYKHPETGSPYHCPSFCHKPNQCKNHTSCPQSYSCTE